MSVYLRKKDRIYSQKSTRDNYINVFFKNLEFRSTTSCPESVLVLGFESWGDKTPLHAI